MALIGKIREKTWILFVFIGLAMLAFILTEFMGKNKQIKLFPGSVYGKDIENEEYQAKLNETMAMDQQEAQQQGRQYTAQDEENSVEKAWNAIIEEKILAKELEALQITVSDKEAESYLLGLDGFPLNPNIEQQFVDATGKFDRRALEQRINQMKTSKDAKEAQNWKQTIEGVKKSREYEKYNQLLSLSSYVTTLEAENEYVAQNEMKDVSFVGKSYAEIPDEEIKVKDEDIKKYYDEHKNEKKWDVFAANREVKYFEIPLQPSAADVAKFTEEMNSLKEKFVKSKNDSMFVLANSDLKLYSKDHRFTYLPEGNKEAQEGLTYPVYMDSIFRHAAIGEVVGPFVQGEVTKIAKVLDKNKYLLSARHILLSAQDSASVLKAEKQADSIVKVLNKDNFEEYVKKYSQDPGSVNTGGKYEDFFDFKMVPEFSKFIVDNPVGKIGWVKTQFGIHIIEVLKKEEVNYPILAVIQKTLAPSEETESNTLNLAYDMIEKIDNKIGKLSDASKKVALFDTIARKNNYFVMAPITIYDNNPRINGVSNPLTKNNIIKFAYDKNAAVGTLSSVPYKADKKYIIAIIAAIREKGVPQFEDVKERMKREVAKEIKAKRIAAQLQGTTNLEATAQKIGSKVYTASVTFANPQLADLGYDAKAVGALYNNLKDGKLTAPIKGENGVYVFKINKTTKAPKTENYEVQREQMMNYAKQSAYNQVRQALYKIADPVDNRIFNQLGILRD
jgi:peptidyl-prolyl cis-trans isomerase D